MTRTSVLGLLPVLALVLLRVATAGDDTVPREDVERDLVLEATRVSPRVLQPGEPVTVRTRLVNRSKTRSYTLLQPLGWLSDGGGNATLYCSAKMVDPHGGRRPVPGVIGHAGTGPPPRHADVMTLAPGASVELGPPTIPVHQQLTLQEAGRVEMTMHYAYTPARSGADAHENPALAAMPAFELRAAPVHFVVVRYVDLELEVVGTLQAGKPTRLSDVLRLHATNLLRDPIHVSGAEFHFEIPRHSTPSSLLTELAWIRATVERKMPPLEGGACRTWSGHPDWHTLRDIRFVPAKAGWVDVVAIWTPTGGKARYASPAARLQIR